MKLISPSFFPNYMGTKTLPPESENLTQFELTEFLTVLVGVFTVFVGSFVLFAASPAIPVEPVFGVSSVEPVSVSANMAVAVSIMAAGTATAVPSLEKIL